MRYRPLALGLSLVLAFVAQSWLAKKYLVTDAALLFGGAGLLALWAMWRGEPSRETNDVPDGPSETKPAYRGRPAQIARAAIAGSVLVAAVLAVYLWTGRAGGDALVLWLLSLLLLFSGVYYLGPRRWPRPDRRALTREGLPLALVLVAGAFLRFYQLDTTPPGSLSDEALVADMVLRLASGLEGPIRSPFEIAWIHPNLPYYPMALVYKVAGPTILTSRTISVLVGLGSVVAFYFLARQLFGVYPALAGAFLMSVSRWHIHISRLGWENVIHVVLLETLAVLFLLRGLKTGRPSDFAWAGVSTGLCVYMYHSGKLLVVTMAVLVLFLLVVERQLTSPSFRRGLAFFLLAASLTLVPLGVTAVKDPSRYIWHVNAVSLWRQADANRQDLGTVVRQNYQDALLIFNYRGDVAPRHNIPTEPAFDVLTASLFALGVVWSLRYGYRREGFLALSWLLIAMSASALSDNSASMSRGIPAISPAMLMIAGFVHQMQQRPQGSPKSADPRPSALALGWATTAALLGLCSITAYLNYDGYFSRYAHLKDVWMAFQNVDWGAARAITSLSVDHEVLSSFDFTDSTVVRYAALSAGVKLRGLGPHDIPFTQRIETGLAYVLASRDVAQYRLLRHYYPEGSSEESRTPWGEASFRTFVLDRAQAESAKGLHGRYYRAADGPPTLAAPRQAIAFGRDQPWPIDALARAEWEGGVFAPEYGSYGFQLAGGGTAVLEVDTREVAKLAIGQPSAEGRVLLYKGIHRVFVRFAADDDAPSLVLTWAPPGQEFQPIPLDMCTVVGPPRDRGLLGSYYHGTEWAGPPAFERIDLGVDFFWPRDEPIPNDSFSVEWNGTVEVPRAGTFRFEITSEGGSWVYIDEKLVVDNGGQHGQQWGRGSVELRQGQHRIRVRYAQPRSQSSPGERDLRLFWSGPEVTHAPIPAEALRPLDRGDER